MTKEQLNKHWEIIKAFKEGKTIEFLSDDEGWLLTINPIFDIHRCYRIKPEPKLVPFDFSDAEKLINKIVKHKRSGIIYLISALSSVVIYLPSHGYIEYDALLNLFEFLDGTPCGKYVEE